MLPPHTIQCIRASSDAALGTALQAAQHSADARHSAGGAGEPACTHCRTGQAAAAAHGSGRTLQRGRSRPPPALAIRSHERHHAGEGGRCCTPACMPCSSYLSASISMQDHTATDSISDNPRGSESLPSTSITQSAILKGLAAQMVLLPPCGEASAQAAAQQAVRSLLSTQPGQHALGGAMLSFLLPSSLSHSQVRCQCIVLCYAAVLMVGLVSAPHVPCCRCHFVGHLAAVQVLALL